jgi:hypothetical protein
LDFTLSASDSAAQRKFPAGQPSTRPAGFFGIFRSAGRAVNEKTPGAQSKENRATIEFPSF